MSYTLDDYDPDEDFDRWYTDTSARWVDGDLSGGARILEVGCATGRMTAVLARGRRSIVAVNLSDAMLDRARGRGLPNVEWVCDDIHRWVDRQHGPFTAVVCCNVLHEVNNPINTLGVMRDQATRSARLYLTVPSPQSLHRIVTGAHTEISARGALYGVRHMWSAETWARNAEAAGWRVRQVSTRILKPYPNETMERLPPQLLDALAAWDGPGGTLTYLIAEAR